MFGLGMRGRRAFEVDEHRRGRCEAEFGKVLSFHIERHRFAYIRRQLIKRISLRHNRYTNALGDISSVALADMELHNAFHFLMNITSPILPYIGSSTMKRVPLP